MAEFEIQFTGGRWTYPVDERGDFTSEDGVAVREGVRVRVWEEKPGIVLGRMWVKDDPVVVVAGSEVPEVFEALELELDE